MGDITFDFEDLDEAHARFVARVDGREGLAQIVITKRGPKEFSADHTEAPESLRGTGAASALVAHMVAEARRLGYRIVPLCPYVRKQYDKNRDWEDVMSVPPGRQP